MANKKEQKELSEEILDAAHLKLEQGALLAVENLLELLECNDNRTRANASQAILNRTIPPKKFRSFKLDIKKMQNLDDVLIAQDMIWLKLANGKMNIEEATAYLSIVENIKNVFLDVKYIKEILIFNEQKRRDVAFQESKGYLASS